MLRAIERGYPQREIERRAYEHQRAVEREERIVVGVNRYVAASEPEVPVAAIDPALETAQVARVRAVRARRAQAETDRALGALRDAATGGGNLLPAIVGSVKALGTVGEIADVLRGVFGEYVPARTL